MNFYRNSKAFYNIFYPLVYICLTSQKLSFEFHCRDLVWTIQREYFYAVKLLTYTVRVVGEVSMSKICLDMTMLHCKCCSILYKLKSSDKSIRMLGRVYILVLSFNSFLVQGLRKYFQSMFAGWRLSADRPMKCYIVQHQFE